MSIVSLEFLIFLFAVIVIYYLVPKKLQWLVLLAGSFCFYLLAGITPFIFVLSTATFVYASGRWMGKIRERNDSKKQAKAEMKKVLILTIIIVFGTLFMMKYYDFFADNINRIFKVFSYDVKMPLVNIILPLGLSFYMFQAIGYCIDVYRYKVDAEKNYLRFLLFITFFPQAVQGPISRYGDLAGQLVEEHRFNYTEFTRGAQLMLWGFFKKLVIADRLSILVAQVFDNYADYDGTQTFIAIIAYAIQIYADFSGGIDIIRGAAQCLGIDLVENFQRPYFATSVAEYWRRWHMSLTNWMRDYVFYSLALSKFSNKIGKWGRKHIKGIIGKQLPSYLPTFVTFFLIGIWHGSGWGFILFGLYNATIIVVSMMLEKVFLSVNRLLHIRKDNFLWKIWQIIRTFLIMAIGKCLTRAAGVKAGLAMIGSCTEIFNFENFYERMSALGLSFGDSIVLAAACLVFFIASIIQENGINIREKLDNLNIVIRWAFLILSVLIVLIFGVYGIGYNAGAFIYMKF